MKRWRLTLLLILLGLASFGCSHSRTENGVQIEKKSWIPNPFGFHPVTESESELNPSESSQN